MKFNKKKIIITGSKGTIGTVLRKGLSKDYQITGLDLPEVDVREYSSLEKIFPGHEVIINLAWDTKTENFNSEKINPDNLLITYNVYQAAINTGVPRVIMASSVHADSYQEYQGELLKADKVSWPDSPYGASKIFMEALGRHYAKYHDLEVICIRFGGVNREDKIYVPEIEKGYHKVWLSHRDCNNLIKKCIEAKEIPKKFTVFYAISNNSKRIHSFQNPVDWKPIDDSFEKIRKVL